MAVYDRISPYRFKATSFVATKGVRKCLVAGVAALLVFRCVHVSYPFFEEVWRAGGGGGRWLCVDHCCRSFVIPRKNWPKGRCRNLFIFSRFYFLVPRVVQDLGRISAAAKGKLRLPGLGRG